MRRYDAVLLDVDGTLVDSNDAHARAWSDAFAACGRDVAYTRIRMMIGMGGDGLVEHLTGLARDSHEAKKLAGLQAERFREELPKLGPLVGARELVLHLLREGYRYTIATSSKADQLALLLRVAGVEDLCELRTTADDVEAAKPHPDVIEAAVSQLGVDRARAVLIGDTPYDIEAAKRAGVDTIAVTSGGFSVESLSGAIAVFDGPADLVASWARSPLA